MDRKREDEGYLREDEEYNNNTRASVTEKKKHNLKLKSYEQVKTEL